jgi:hypothetical protein
MPVTTTSRIQFVPRGQPRPAVGSWRAVGLLRVKNVEHELACVLDLNLGDTRPDAPSRITIGSSWVIDPRWITSKRIPALGRRIVMTCSFSLEPDM